LDVVLILEIFVLVLVLEVILVVILVILVVFVGDAGVEVVDGLVSGVLVGLVSEVVIGLVSGVVDGLDVLICFVVVFVVFQVGDGDAVQFVEAGQGIGLFVLVGDDSPREGLPGCLRAAGGEQGVSVGVEEPGGPRALLSVGQLGTPSASTAASARP